MCDAKRRHRFDEMFAGIEDQKNPLVPQISDQAGRCIVGLNRQPQHGGHSCGHQIGIAQHAKIDEEHGAGEGLDQIMSNRYRNRGFADAAGADDRDKACGGQLRREHENVIGRARPFAIKRLGRLACGKLAATAACALSRSLDREIGATKQ